ncbi:MAG: formylglycine-generating enzyme family protein [Phycisphaerales bacterium]
MSFTLSRCPSGEDGEGNTIPPLWTLTTEVPWELYDVFVYALDVDAESENDAIARPSKPYVPPDRGFGHEGYPAMGMTHAAAEAFCVWLSEKTGIRYRLPTAAEWTHLASASNPIDEVGDINALAWTNANAEFTTHQVMTRLASDFGLYDMLGNVAEWVTSDTRRPIAMGGSYRDPPHGCQPNSFQQQSRSWNASDPQIPKSNWWLADCSWVGFRFVTEQDPTEVSDDDE